MWLRAWVGFGLSRVMPGREFARALTRPQHGAPAARRANSAPGGTSEGGRSKMPVGVAPLDGANGGLGGLCFRLAMCLAEPAVTLSSRPAPSAAAALLTGDWRGPLAGCMGQRRGNPARRALLGLPWAHRPRPPAEFATGPPSRIFRGSMFQSAFIMNVAFAALEVSSPSFYPVPG